MLQSIPVKLVSNKEESSNRMNESVGGFFQPSLHKTNIRLSVTEQPKPKFVQHRPTIYSFRRTVEGNMSYN